MVDSKPITVKMTPNPDPMDPKLAELSKHKNYSKCVVDHDQMKYNPIQIRFIHLDKRTSNRKLMWHEDDLMTDVRHSTPILLNSGKNVAFQIELRRCAVFNEDQSGGSWDADKCTTVLTEQTNTVCECSTFGTVAVIIEKVEPPYVTPEYGWLTITKYAGYIISIIVLLIFIGVISLSP